MSDFLNAKELADLEVNGLPKSVKNIIGRAKREKWPSRKRIGRGGGVEYQISALPELIQEAIRVKQANILLEQAKAEEPKPTREVAKRRETQLALPLDDLMKGFNTKQKDCAHARMALAAEVIHVHRTTGMPVKKSVAFLLQKMEDGTLDPALMKLVPIANNRSRGAVRLCQRSLMGWVSDYKSAKSPNERLALLAPAKCSAHKPIDAYTWLGNFLMYHARPQAPALAHSYEDFCQWWEESGKPAAEMPSYHTVRRVWMSLPEPMKQRGRKTGPAYKKVLPYEKRDWDVLEPNDVWIGDGHSFKAKVAHPVHGSPFKPEVTVIIDGCTRMIMGFSVSLAESCIAVCDALRISMKHYGLPLIYYSDNGAGQTAKTIDHEITGVAARLGIEHRTGIAGHPQGRGIIERWWKDNLVRLARDYDTFVGNGMDETTKNMTYRKLESAIKAEKKGKELTAEQRRYRTKLPSWKQFMADVSATIIRYNQRPHSELPKKPDGTRYSPAEYRLHRMAMMKQDGLEIEMLGHTELDTLFRPEEIRTVRNGWLDLLNFEYFSHDLANHHGKKVRVSYDLDDASAVKVYDLEGHYICRAELNANKHPAFEVESVRMLKDKQRADNRARNLKNKLAEVEEERRGLVDLRNDLPMLGQSAHKPEKLPAEVIEDVEYEVVSTGTDTRTPKPFRYF